MTLKEAIESGKPFRRPDEFENPTMFNIRGGGNSKFSYGEVCATDWILKYDCDTCKNTGRVDRQVSDGVNYISKTDPCPDCSAPKLKLEVGKSYLNGLGTRIRIASRGMNLKGELLFIGDNDEYFGSDGHCFRPVKECNLVSEAKDNHPKMKKITMYRPIIESNYYQGYLMTGQWCLRKEDAIEQNDLDSMDVVGWESKEIEVLDEEAK